MADPDEVLDDFFDAGRRTRAEASDALLARVEAEALAEIDRRATAPAPQAGAAGWRGVIAALGGWRAGTGLVAATMAGIAIGVNLGGSVATFAGWTTEMTEYGIGDFAPGYGVALLADG